MLLGEVSKYPGILSRIVCLCIHAWSHSCKDALTRPWNTDLTPEDDQLCCGYRSTLASVMGELTVVGLLVIRSRPPHPRWDRAPPAELQGRQARRQPLAGPPPAREECATSCSPPGSTSPRSEELGGRRDKGCGWDRGGPRRGQKVRRSSSDRGMAERRLRGLESPRGAP